MRAARRMSRSPSVEPVRATRMRSRVSQAVPLPVRGERLVDAIGEPCESELTERRQVPRPEVVRERRVDALGRVDVAARKAVPERERGEIDELDLVGAPDDGVRDRLALFYS